MKAQRKRLAQSLAAALAAACLVPNYAFAQTNSPNQPNTPISLPTVGPMPTPSGSPLPYPAYGTPAPTVGQRQQKPGVPTEVTLQQSVSIAVAQSPAFASERAQYLAIAAKYGAEQGALYPSLSGNASVQRQYGGTRTGVGTGATPPPGTTNSSVLTGPFTNVNGTLNLDQLIYDGGRVIAGIRTAKESDYAGRETLLRQLQTLALNVAQSYFAVLQAQATVSADALLVRQFETQLNSVAAQIRAGAAARSDYATAEFQVAQARGSLVTAQGQVITAEALFSTTLGLDADTLVAPQRGTTAGQRIRTYPDAVKLALTTRPDYLAAQHTVESSKENLRFAKLARFPILTANASAGYTESLPATSPKLLSTQTLGATLQIPIYDQGLTNFNVALAASQLDQANAGLISSRLTVESDVRGALAGLISAQAALVQAQSEYQSAQVSLQATEAQYRVGASTITALVVVQAQLATAQKDFVTATYNVSFAQVQYAYALGMTDLTL